MIFDAERNQLAVPIVRPENEAVYKRLSTMAADFNSTPDSPTPAPQSTLDEARTPGIIGRPRLNTQQEPLSPVSSPTVITSAAPSEPSDGQKVEAVSDGPARSSTELNQPRQNDDARSATGSEKSYHTPTSKTSAGVWGASWRDGSKSYQQEPAISKSASGYSRANAPRNMKVLRPGKSMSNAARASSSSNMATNGVENQPPRLSEVDRRTSTTSVGDAKAQQSAPTKSNPIGQASAFGWLNSGQQKRAVANGE